MKLDPSLVARNSSLATLDLDLCAAELAENHTRRAWDEARQNLTRIRMKIADVKWGLRDGVIVTWQSSAYVRPGPGLPKVFKKVTHTGRIFRVHPDCDRYGTDKVWVHAFKKDGTLSKVEKTLYSFDKWSIVP